jgi:hypothetical protein
VEIDYQLTEDEYFQAQLGYWSQVRRVNLVRVEMVLASVFFVFGLVILALPQFTDKAPGVGLLCISVIFLLNRYVYAPYNIRRTFRRSPNTNGKHHVAITGEDLKIVLPNASSEVRSEGFQKAHELKAEFLLMYSPRSFVIIPKRAFDAEGLDQFRSMLKAKGLL